MSCDKKTKEQKTLDADPANPNVTEASAPKTESPMPDREQTKPVEPAGNDSAKETAPESTDITVNSSGTGE